MWVIQTSPSCPNDTETVRMIHANKKREYTTSFLKLSLVFMPAYIHICMFVCILSHPLNIIFILRCLTPINLSSSPVLNIMYNLFSTQISKHMEKDEWEGRSVEDTGKRKKWVGDENQRR